MPCWPAWCCDIDGIDSVHVHTVKVTGVFSLVDSSTMAHGQSTTAPRVAISNAKFAKVLRYHLGGAARWWGEPSHEKQICSYRIWPVCFASKKTREFCKLKRKLCHFRFTFILPYITESYRIGSEESKMVPCCGMSASTQVPTAKHDSITSLTTKQLSLCMLRLDLFLVFNHVQSRRVHGTGIFIYHKAIKY